MINNPIILKFFEDFTNHRKKTNWAVVSSSRPFPNILNTGNIDETFQQSGKEDSFRQSLKNLASKYESSGSQFFRTTTGIQSGLDAFDESRFVITSLTILGVMDILCSFRLVLEKKTDKEKPESSRFELLEKFLANNFALSDARRQHLWFVE